MVRTSLARFLPAVLLALAACGSVGPDAALDVDPTIAAAEAEAEAVPDGVASRQAAVMTTCPGSYVSEASCSGRPVGSTCTTGTGSQGTCFPWQSQQSTFRYCLCVTF